MAVLDEADSHQEMEEVGEVEGKEAGDADEEDEIDGVQGLPFESALGDVRNSPGDQRVADQDHHKGDQKPENQHTDVIRQHAPLPRGFPKALEAYLGAADVGVERPSQDQRAGDAQPGRPEENGDQGVVGALDPDIRQGVQDGQVAVHADGGEEGHAEVDVEEVHAARDAASHVPEGPVVVVKVVVDLEGQDADEQGVHHGQVEQVDVGARGVRDPAGQQVEGGPVFQQAQHEDGNVDGGEEEILEVGPKAALLAGVGRCLAFHLLWSRIRSLAFACCRKPLSPSSWERRQPSASSQLGETRIRSKETTGTGKAREIDKRILKVKPATGIGYPDFGSGFGGVGKTRA